MVGLNAVWAMAPGLPTPHEVTAHDGSVLDPAGQTTSVEMPEVFLTDRPLDVTVRCDFRTVIGDPVPMAWYEDVGGVVVASWEGESDGDCPDVSVVV